MIDVGLLLALAWLACGFAAVALVPHERAARLLCAAGVLLTGDELLTAPVRSSPVTASGAVLVQLQNAAFFATIITLTALLLVYPAGGLERRWHGVLLLVLLALAALGVLLLLFTAPRVSVDGSGTDGVTHVNPLAIPGLAPLGVVAEVIFSTTPAWPLAGLVALVQRWVTGDAERRRSLRPLLGGIAMFGVLLVVVVVTILINVPTPTWFPVVFQGAFAVLPIVLLAGISARARALEREVAASRARLLTEEDRARREIQRDLHDGVQQQLVGILSLVHLAGRHVARNEPDAEPLLDEASGRVREAIDDLRAVVSGIRPPVLHDAGVGAALSSRLHPLGAAVAVDVHSAGSRRHDDAVEAAAYFAGCEAVTNAVKHGAGSPIAVQVTEGGSELVVQVDDSGPGIPADWNRGRGLSGLQDRVHSLGGRFEVSVRPEGGTRVLVRFDS